MSGGTRARKNSFFVNVKYIAGKLFDTTGFSDGDGFAYDADTDKFVPVPLTATGDLFAANNLSDIENAVTALSNLGGEPAFAKGTAFNKNFGTVAGTVAEGNHNHDLAYAASGHNHSGTYEPANANIQSHVSATNNPHGVTLLQLGDFPSAYVADKWMKVNATADGIEFVDAPIGGGGDGIWGSITGTLADQTDLQDALNTKAETGHDHSGTYEAANANIQSHISDINKHIDWTSTNKNLVTSGYIRIAVAGSAHFTLEGNSTSSKTIYFVGPNALGDINMAGEGSNMNFNVALKNPLQLLPTGEVQMPEYGSFAHVAETNCIAGWDANGKMVELANVNWALVGNTPTTLGGYGITDAATSSHQHTEFLSKTNTDVYTPTLDYHPATKKYVDDNAGGGGSASVVPVVVTADVNNVSDIDLGDGTYYDVALEADQEWDPDIVNEITIVDTISQSFGGNSSGDFTLPDSQENDLIVLLVGCDSGTPATPSGWSVGAGAVYGATLRAFYLVVGATPPTSVALSGFSTSTSAIAYTFRNVDITTPMDVAGTTATMYGDPDSPSITPVSDNCMIVALGVLDDDNVESSVVAPTGFSNLVAKQSTTTGMTTMVATLIQETAAAINPSYFYTSGNDSAVGATLALRPAVGGYINTPAEITMSNVPTGVVSEILVHLTTDKEAFTYPSSWNWNWLPDFSVFDDLTLRLITDDEGTSWNVFLDVELSSYIDKNAIAASEIDWLNGGIFTKTLSADTTFTFANVQLNKVLTLILDGDYTITWPENCNKLSGDYDGSVANYIQLHCTGDGDTLQFWRTISQTAV